MDFPIFMAMQWLYTYEAIVSKIQFTNRFFRLNSSCKGYKFTGNTKRVFSNISMTIYVQSNIFFLTNLHITLSKIPTAKGQLNSE